MADITLQDRPVARRIDAGRAAVLSRFRTVDSIFAGLTLGAAILVLVLLGGQGIGGVVMGADGDPPLRMEYVSNLADVQVGDLVTTSGLDGIFPRGFVIGRVDRVERGAGLYREIRVRPRVDVAALDVVLIVLEQAGTGDDSP